MTSLQPADIRRRRAENPKMRERDLARVLGISEAELVAPIAAMAPCGSSRAWPTSWPRCRASAM